MTERTSYLPGTPSWVDLGSPNPAEAAAFYGGLFGWEVTMDPRPEAGGYGLFSLRDKVVAGLGPQMNAEMPPFWAVYVTVADADATTALAAEAGGTVVMDPMDVLDAGRMAIVQDPLGSFISFWQPNAHPGSGLVNEPGAFTWCELSSPDVAVSKAFYGTVLGWGLLADAGPDDTAHFTVAGELVCGAHTAGPGEFPAWSVWFSVADCDASTAQAVDLGGSVIMPPNDMSFGRGAMVADPHGAVFGIGAMGSIGAP